MPSARLRPGGGNGGNCHHTPQRQGRGREGGERGRGVKRGGTRERGGRASLHFTLLHRSPTETSTLNEAVGSDRAPARSMSGYGAAPACRAQRKRRKEKKRGGGGGNKKQVGAEIDPPPFPPLHPYPPSFPCSSSSTATPSYPEFNLSASHSLSRSLSARLPPSVAAAGVERSQLLRRGVEGGDCSVTL